MAVTPKQMNRARRAFSANAFAMASATRLLRMSDITYRRISLEDQITRDRRTRSMSESEYVEFVREEFRAHVDATYKDIAVQAADVHRECSRFSRESAARGRGIGKALSGGYPELGDLERKLIELNVMDSALDAYSRSLSGVSRAVQRANSLQEIIKAVEDPRQQIVVEVAKPYINAAVNAGLRMNRLPDAVTRVIENEASVTLDPNDRQGWIAHLEAAAWVEGYLQAGGRERDGQLFPPGKPESDRYFFEHMEVRMTDYADLELPHALARYGIRQDPVSNVKAVVAQAAGPMGAE